MPGSRGYFGSYTTLPSTSLLLQQPAMSALGVFFSVPRSSPPTSLALNAQSHPRVASDAKSLPSKADGLGVGGLGEGDGDGDGAAPPTSLSDAGLVPMTVPLASRKQLMLPAGRFSVANTQFPQLGSCWQARQQVATVVLARPLGWDWTRVHFPAHRTSVLGNGSHVGVTSASALVSFTLRYAMARPAVKVMLHQPELLSTENAGTAATPPRLTNASEARSSKAPPAGSHSARNSRSVRTVMRVWASQSTAAPALAAGVQPSAAIGNPRPGGDACSLPRLEAKIPDTDENNIHAMARRPAWIMVTLDRKTRAGEGLANSTVSEPAPT